MEKKCQVFSYADDTSILCNYRDYDYAYNDLLSAASTMIQYVQNELHAGKPWKISVCYF